MSNWRNILSWEFVRRPEAFYEVDLSDLAQRVIPHWEVIDEATEYGFDFICFRCCNPEHLYIQYSGSTIDERDIHGNWETVGGDDRDISSVGCNECGDKYIISWMDILEHLDRDVPIQQDLINRIENLSDL